MKMLTREEYRKLEQELKEMFQYSDWLYGMLEALEHINENYTQHSKEFKVTDLISENVKRYFGLNHKIEKLKSLDCDQWANNAQLDLAVNKIIETVNKIIDKLEVENVD